jgi:hypothetical protein
MSLRCKVVNCLVRAAGVISMKFVLPVTCPAAGAFYTASRRKEGPKLTEALACY